MKHGVVMTTALVIWSSNYVWRSWRWHCKAV